MVFPFDLAVVIAPRFTAQASTIWPKVNDLAQEVDELVAADEALIAVLNAQREPKP